MPVTRRDFIALGVLGTLAFAGVARAAPARRRLLVVVFQRGAVDGLSMVVPHGDPDYRAARPGIAVDKPVDLDGHFALHPALAPLKPAWNAGELGVVHAAGSQAATRSHFQAQDYMETGTPDVATTPDGWANRLIAAAAPATFGGVALVDRVPRALAGRAPALAVGDPARFRLRGPARVQAGFAAMYGGSDVDPVRRAGGRALEAVSVVRALHPERYQPENGARYPDGKLGQQLRAAAFLAKADLGMQLAWVDVGGWDTHVAQTPRLARALGELGSGLAAFRADLGERMRDVVVLTLTEFGRTVAENGSGGTDHGHGSAYLVMGGPVRGRIVHGRFPGLAPSARYQGRDLAVTTDFRDLLAEIATRHLGIAPSSGLFPGHVAGPARYPGVIS